ncbi:hypothetical protein GCM10027408_25430 [Microbacterium tumbae]
MLLALGWLLFVVALISLFLSSEISGVDYALSYAAVMLFFAGLLVFFAGYDFSFSRSGAIGPSFVAIAFVMMAVALLQQFVGLSVFSGTDLGTFRTEVRPSAMTGSFLHYPIALAIVSFVVLGIYEAKRHWIYLTTGIAGMACVVVSYSRSGMVIVIAGLAFALVLSRNLRFWVRAIVLLPILGVILLLIFPLGSYIERFFTIFRADGAGNAGRLEAWGTILRIWAESPLWVGSHAGQFTNITSNLSETAAIASPESGILQLLVSFGVLGVISYYGIMLTTVLATPKTSPWFRAGLLACIVQSFVYQSVEVLPFMVLFALVPLVAKAVPVPVGQHKDGPKRRGRQLVRHQI